mgnify:FL=1
MRLFINILLLTIISACSSVQNSNTEGEYRYVPITEALKKLSDEEVAIRLRTASLTCENDMLKVYVPSRTVDPEGWENGQRERRRYFSNCLELKGFERKWIPLSVIKKQKRKDDRELTSEELLKKPRYL